MRAWCSPAVGSRPLYHATVHTASRQALDQAKWKKKLLTSARTVHTEQPCQAPLPAPARSSAPASSPAESRPRDSERGRKAQAGPLVYEDAHGNADVNVAAAGRSGDGGGGGSGGGAGGGASVVELGGLHCHCVTAGAQRQVRIFFKSTHVFTMKTHVKRSHKHLLEGSQ